VLHILAIMLIWNTHSWSLCSTYEKSIGSPGPFLPSHKSDPFVATRSRARRSISLDPKQSSKSSSTDKHTSETQNNVPKARIDTHKHTFFQANWPFSDTCVPLVPPTEKYFSKYRSCKKALISRISRHFPLADSTGLAIGLPAFRCLSCSDPPYLDTEHPNSDNLRDLRASAAQPGCGSAALRFCQFLGLPFFQSFQQTGPVNKAEDGADECTL
jgi:hypothetical protein